MPLKQPAERERLHTRAIEINGYRRADGRYDIEAHLTDSKSFGQCGVIPTTVRKVRRKW